MFEAKFQSFDVEDIPRAQIAARVAALRAELSRRGLDGFVVPRADRQQDEYLPPSEERLKWLTGFSGSAGVAVVLTERAALFVDGRYTLQARDQVDTALFSIEHLIDSPPHVWLEGNLKPGAKLGYDSWLHTVGGAEKLAKACAAAGAELEPAEPNPIDAIWTDRPLPPLGPVVPHDLRFAGESAASKLARMQAEIAKAKADALVVSDAQAVAWAFNIRGADVAHTPLPLAFAIVPREGRPSLHVDGRKLGNEVRHALEEILDVREEAAFGKDLAALGSAHKKVRLDDATAADALAKIVTESGGKILRGADPIALMKAVKNPVEIDGTRAAHRRDGAALTRFLAWLAREAPNGRLSEIPASDRLEAFRREGEYFRDLSFPTISGAGSNGAIVHYRATPETEKVLEPGTLFLLDSGAQYLDGTTDITRTVAIGEPSAEMRDHFTRVLKGHIALATARFPKGTTGAQLDARARRALWQKGLDYDHGTGHGVGSYLSVHEGPQRISKAPNVQPLLPGMIVSNEPGYYKTGAYGIRIENLVVVQPSENGGERDMLCFETVTLAPLDRTLVAPDLLEDDEILWFDAYQTRVREVIAPLVDRDTARWLEAATAPIG